MVFRFILKWNPLCLFLLLENDLWRFIICFFLDLLNNFGGWNLEKFIDDYFLSIFTMIKLQFSHKILFFWINFTLWNDQFWTVIHIYFKWRTWTNRRVSMVNKQVFLMRNLILLFLKISLHQFLVNQNSLKTKSLKSLVLLLVQIWNKSLNSLILSISYKQIDQIHIVSQ